MIGMWQKGSRVLNAIIRRLTGCAKMSNFIFLKVSRALNVTIKRLIGIAIIATGTLRLGSLAKNVEKKRDLMKLILITIKILILLDKQNYKVCNLIFIIDVDCFLVFIKPKSTM